MASSTFPLDTLGQQPRINRLYTQLIFCYKLADDSLSAQQDVVRGLSDGLGRLTDSFPWVAGRVVNCNGVFEIQPSETAPQIYVQDRRDDSSMPAWEDLERARFPFHMLEESKLAPVNTLSDESPSAEPLVFLLQATFISGGLLLTFCGQHGSMDMTGQTSIIKLFAMACRNEIFSEEQLQVGNMRRFDILSLPGPRHGQQTGSKESVYTADSDPTPHISGPAPLIPPTKWIYLSFSSSSLRNIKASAETDIPAGTFVSTDDALSAFIWKTITRIRLARLTSYAASANGSNPVSSTIKTTLSRNVDMRRHLGLPPSYPGLVVTSTTHTVALDELNRTPLGHIAAQLRASLEDVDGLRRSIQDAAVAASGREGSGKAGKARPDHEVRLTSWAKETCYNVDFGGLGHGIRKPIAVRRPTFSEGARDGLVIFLPKGLDGSIVVGVCLREDDILSLVNDEVEKLPTNNSTPL